MSTVYQEKDHIWTFLPQQTDLEGLDERVYFNKIRRIVREGALNICRLRPVGSQYEAIAHTRWHRFY